jgi:hypothetical protein
VAELIKFEFVINLKRPRALGLPLNLLITAAEILLRCKSPLLAVSLV